MGAHTVEHERKTVQLERILFHITDAHHASHTIPVSPVSLLSLPLFCSSFFSHLRTCRICEDVANTYHDSYRCAGENVDLWGLGTDPSIPACDESNFHCDMLVGDVAQACKTMEQDMLDDPRLARILWVSQMEFGKAYETCVRMEKCPQDPDEQEGIFTRCRQVFDSPEGHHDILLPGFTTNCTEECYLCTWLVREWPLFQEIW